MTFNDVINNLLRDKTLLKVNLANINKPIADIHLNSGYDGQATITLKDGTEIDIYPSIDDLLFQDH